ncbi:MAG: hypothetical protein K1X28_00890 [Parachlamydiales bacterium]|nr:hypothetical protein [Parachlamydiales bacterium]
MEIQEVELPNPLVLNPWLESTSAQEGVLQLEEEPLKENFWGFSYYTWLAVKEKFGSVEKLYAAIQDIHRQIKELKEEYRKQGIELPDLTVEYNTDGGVSGSYFLIDAEGKRRFVVKPLDEDAGAIHSISYSSPFLESPFRDNMPLYRSSMREVLAYRVAQLIGASSIVPKTDFVVMKSEQFHDLFESLTPDERKRYLEIIGEPDKEKLCSVQEYVENAKSLFEALHDLQMSGLSDEEIANRFDQKDFEEANMLLWTTYDTDGHSGNFLVYSKGVDAVGNEILGLKKIDNGLAFPDKNKQLRNNLAYMPNAKRELSEETKAKILAIDPDALAAEFEKVGLESAIPAMRARISTLQELVMRENITIGDINSELSKIGRKI